MTLEELQARARQLAENQTAFLRDAPPGKFLRPDELRSYLNSRPASIDAPSRFPLGTEPPYRPPGAVVTDPLATGVIAPPPVVTPPVVTPPVVIPAPPVPVNYPPALSPPSIPASAPVPSISGEIFAQLATSDGAQNLFDPSAVPVSLPSNATHSRPETRQPATWTRDTRSQAGGLDFYGQKEDWQKGIGLKARQKAPRKAHRAKARAR